MTESRDWVCDGSDSNKSWSKIHEITTNKESKTFQGLLAPAKASRKLSNP